MNRFDPVKVGVVGLGSFGMLHARTLSGLAEADLVAVCARREVSIEELRRRGLEVAGWTDLDRAINESDAEAWVVATSTSAHIDIARILLEAGKPVLLEKPISQSLEEAESIRTLVERDSSNLMLAHIVLFSSEFRQLMDEVRDRGRPRFITSVRHRPASLAGSYPEETPLYLLMTHDLYCIQALLDGREPTSFDAQAIRPVPDGPTDLHLAQLTWGSEAIASLAASFMTPEGMGPQGYDRLEVFGDGWMARLRSNPRPFDLWDDKARYPMDLEIRSDSMRPSGMLAEELRGFCRVVRGMELVPLGARYEDAIQIQRWQHELSAAVKVRGNAR